MQITDEKKKQIKRIIGELLLTARKLDAKWQAEYKEMLFLLDKADQAAEVENFTLAAELIGQAESRLKEVV